MSPVEYPCAVDVVITIGLALVEEDMATVGGEPEPFHVALPILVGSGLASTLIISELYIRTAVAPLVNVCHLPPIKYCLALVFANAVPPTIMANVKVVLLTRPII